MADWGAWAWCLRVPLGMTILFCVTYLLSQRGYNTRP